MVTELKKCPYCKAVKPLDDFGKRKFNKNGLLVYCKICTEKARIINADWYKNNKEKAKRITMSWRRNNYRRFRINQEKWLKNHPEYSKILQRKRCKNNLKHIRMIQAEWRKNNPEKVRKTTRRANQKKYSTIKGNLDCRMSSAIRQSICKNKNGRKWESLVGYNLQNLIKHLESKFINGMSWENRRLWQIDHIIPISRFHYEKPEDPEFKVCWGLANLQPLWTKENWSKHNKTMEEWKAVS